MDKEKCMVCVCSNDRELHSNSVCETCYQIDKKGNGSNYYFIEKIDKPSCCKDCVYCNKPQIPFQNRHICGASQTFDKDERTIYRKYIRKNYLQKGMPKWCPLN